MATRGLLPALCFTFLLTFIVFPALVQDTNFRFLAGTKSEESWFVLSTLTLFNLFDTLGRMSASLTFMKLSRRMTLLANYCRTFFLATFLLVAFEAGPAWLFTSDWFKVLNMVLFAFTNGWLSSLCVIITPEHVKQSERGEIGALINPTIVGGILIGSILAIPLEQVLKLTPKHMLQA